MKIGILLYPYCSLWSATGSFELFNRANKAYKYYNGENANNKKFEVSFVADEKNSIKTSYPFPIKAEYGFDNHPTYDLVLIPGFETEPDIVLKESHQSAEWVFKMQQKGAVVASICTGALLMLKSGLVANRTATTHWVAKAFFEHHFPEVNLDVSKTVIDYGDIMMSGSATSFQNLIIRIIERYMGREVAVGVSKIYLIDMNKDRPDSYMDLVLSKKHNDDEIIEAQDYIKENYNQKLSLEEIADNISMSKRTFIRRFKKATSETPLNYIHKVKVEKAKQILENERRTFEEISFLMGYEDVHAFRKIFVKQTGISPMRYKARYQLVN